MPQHAAPQRAHQPPPAPSKPAAYQDPTQPLAARVEDLLARMTLSEKLGQLNMPMVLPPELAALVGNNPTTLEDCQRLVDGTYTDIIGPIGGFFGLAAELLKDGARAQASGHNTLQSISARTRLGIPLLLIEEGTHGVMASAATVFPEGPGLGSSWNADLVGAVYAATAREARAVGIHVINTVVIEPIRDPRMGRSCEAFSEDSYLTSEFARTIAQRMQQPALDSAESVVTSFTAYPGQSQPAGGLEWGEMALSERSMREVFLPPWLAGVQQGGAWSVMAAYPVVDGTPVHASEHYLSEILRDELGFEGIVLSEGFGFQTLLDERVVATQQEAGLLALRAGVDVNISYEDAYLQALLDAVAQGLVPLALIDRAVRRVLGLKFRLGLFETAQVDVERAAAVVHAEDHQALALQAARESVVLLKNEHATLPLKKNLRSIAVLGPNAHNPRNQCGDYTVEAPLQPITTILDAIKTKVGTGVTVTYAEGCAISGNDRSGFAAAVAAAAASDVALVVVGERFEGHFGGNDPRLESTNGEGRDVASLDLSGVQEEFVQAIHATGTPTIVVLVNGRPLSTRWIAEHIPALLEAWCPGEQGGSAVADILFGDYNPDGRLPISIARHVGQLPMYYNYKPSKANRLHGPGSKGYVDMPATPLYAFGHGLSYTTFAYSNLRITPETISATGSATVSVDVANVGALAGQEVVQLYIRDLLSSVTTPVMQLRGFQKVPLAPGQRTTLTFAFGPEELAVLDRSMHWVVEPGSFEIMVGSASDAIQLSGTLTVE